MTSSPVFSAMSAREAGEVLTLQRAAYVSEAQLYDDVRLPALTQTVAELAAELELSFGVTARLDGRLVGAVRARVDGEVMHIGRLVVAPDVQGRGIGSALLRRVESLAPDGVRRLALFTGHLSVANLRLYAGEGYVETRRETVRPGLELVHLEKPVPAGPAAGRRPVRE